MKDNYLKYDWPKHKEPCNTCYFKTTPITRGFCNTCIHLKEKEGVASPVHGVVIPRPASTGVYDYKGYVIRTAHKNGGKVGKNNNRTSTLQITELMNHGYLIKKQISFIVGDKKNYDKAWNKAVKWIDKNLLAKGGRSGKDKS